MTAALSLLPVSDKGCGCAGAAAGAAHGAVELAAAGALLAGALDHSRAARRAQGRLRGPRLRLPALRRLLHQQPRRRGPGISACACFQFSGAANPNSIHKLPPGCTCQECHAIHNLQCNPAAQCPEDCIFIEYLLSRGVDQLVTVEERKTVTLHSFLVQPC